MANYNKPRERDPNWNKKPKEIFRENHYENLLNIEGQSENVSEEQRIKLLNGIFTDVENLLKAKANGITPSQLRNIYGRVKSAQEISDPVLLRPKLAYIAARQGNSELTNFISDLIKRVENPCPEKKLCDPYGSNSCLSQKIL